MADNYRVMKVVESIVTTYGVTCDESVDAASLHDIIEAAHTLTTLSPRLQTIQARFDKIAKVSDIKSRVEYQLINDRPKKGT